MTKSYSITKGAGVGAASGVIAGIVMLAFMIVTTIQMGMPPNAVPVVMGMAMGQGMNSAATAGIAYHLFTSTIIGIIFGVVTSRGKLRPSSFEKGVGLGIAAGLIAFSVLFLPMMNTMGQQMTNLMQMMNSKVPQTMIMQKMQAMMPAIVGNNLVVHIIFGAVLGFLVAAMFRKISRYGCAQCHMQFKDEKELNKHSEQYHTATH